MASVATDMQTRLYNALQQQEPETVKAILEPLDNEERKALLTSQVTLRTGNHKTVVLCGLQDPESLRIILEGISTCDRLDLLLTDVNIPSPSSFGGRYIPWLYRFAWQNHHPDDHLKLECYKVIKQSITDQEWRTILRAKTGTGYNRTLIHAVIAGMSENMAELLKFLFDSISSTELVNLLQLKQGGPDNRVQTIQNLFFRKNSREALQVLMQYIDKTELICLLQTPFRIERGQISYDGDTVYDESHGKHLKVDTSSMREIATTVIHSIAERSENKLRPGYDGNGEGIAWEETLLHLVLSGLDSDDVVTLLSTQDGDGNTPIHQCNYFSTICLVLELIEDNNLRFQLMTRKNDNGDTPLHVMCPFANLSEVRLEILNTTDLTTLLCIQNNQGNTVLHKRLRDLENNYWTDFIKEVRSRSLDHSFHVLLKNSEGKTFLHNYLDEHRKDMSQRGGAGRSCFFMHTTPQILPILDAIGLPNAARILIEKDENGEAPVHPICTLHPQLMPEICESLSVTSELLTETDKHGNTALHILALHHPDYLFVMLEHLPERELGKVFQILNTDRNTPLHLLSTKSAYLHIIPQVLNMIQGDEGVTASELMTIKNKLGATPLNIALLGSSGHGNRHAFKKIVDVLGTGNILDILEINISLSEYETLCSYHSTADCEEILNNLGRCSRYYILYTMGNKACTDLRRCIQTLNDAELSRRKEDISGFSNPVPQEYILSIEKLKYENGNSLLHLLAEGATESDHASVRKLLEAMTVDQRYRALSRQNYGRQTPLECANSYKIKKLLEWSYAQEGFYYLQSPPVVLMMYSTADRTGADEESRTLEAAFPQFDVAVRRIVNPKRQEILDAIMNEGRRSERISAMIVIIMSHGEQGSVCAADGDVKIQDILLQMQAAIPQGQPKVLLVQACQKRRPNQPSLTIAENVQSDPAPPSSQPRRTTESELVAPSTSSQPLNTTHHYSHQSLSQDFSLQWRDFITMIATVSGGLAYRNQMIPMFAEELKDSKNNGDIYEIFLKTHHRLQKLIPDQVPEFRSTLTQKLSLRNIFRI